MLSVIPVAKNESAQLEVSTVPASSENVNMFFEFYRPAELTVFEDLYQFFMSRATRLVLPHFPVHVLNIHPSGVLAALFGLLRGRCHVKPLLSWHVPVSYTHLTLPTMAVV